MGLGDVRCAKRRSALLKDGQCRYIPINGSVFRGWVILEHSQLTKFTHYNVSSSIRGRQQHR